ncbi:MAG TPA: response regulator [Thermoanaerobaculia bacterium]|nr:response regulator [Thermoanaerobaculia bacterium]
MSQPAHIGGGFPREEPLPCRALVVEDDDAIRFLTAQILRREGFSVDEGTNGREALELLSDREYDVVLLDLAMPEMNGLDVLDHVSRRMPQILRRIIVITASLHLLRAGLPEGVCRVLTKPFDLGELTAAIGDCMAVCD